MRWRRTAIWRGLTSGVGSGNTRSGAKLADVRDKALDALTEVVHGVFTDIMDESKRRYMDGCEKTVMGKNGEPFTFTAYDTQEGDLALKAAERIAKLKGLNAPDKTAFTDPSGLNEASPLSGLTAAELLRRRAEAEAQRAEKLSDEPE